MPIVAHTYRVPNTACRPLLAPLQMPRARTVARRRGNKGCPPMVSPTMEGSPIKIAYLA